jgi:predicted Zn-dependent protease
MPLENPHEVSMSDPVVEVQKIARDALKYADGSEAEVIATLAENAVTRFAENAISQNVSRHSLAITIRVLKGKRTARVSTDSSDEASLRQAFQKAYELVEFQKESPEMLPLPEPKPIRPVAAYETFTAELQARARADAVLKAISVCKKAGMKAAGICSSGWGAVGIANTKGVLASHKDTTATFSVSVQSGDSSGWAESSDRDFLEIDVDKLVGVALEKALMSRNAAGIEPGAYVVVLEPAAVTELLQFMGWFGFAGLSFVEDRSFMAGRLGQQVLGRNITIQDDAFHSMQRGLPFDFEGLPRQSVTLVEKGMAKAVVHDRVTAARAHTETTGHALPQPSVDGPMPLNLVLASGDSSVEEMIASTPRGILVTRFHYTNLVEPIKLVLTGMTRDGTFLIEKGKVKSPLKNLRFTQSVVDALNEVEMISRDQNTMLADWGPGAYTAPALKIRRFNFSSGTEF